MIRRFLSRLGGVLVTPRFISAPSPLPPHRSLQPGFGGDSPSGDTGPRPPQTRSPCRGVRRPPGSTWRLLGSHQQPRTPAHAPSPLSLLCRDGGFLAPGGRWPRPSPRTGCRRPLLGKWRPSRRRWRRASQRVRERGALGPQSRRSSDPALCRSQAAISGRRSRADPGDQR